MAFPWLAAAIFTSTAVSYMGSMRQSQTLATSAAWDKYHQKIDQSYKTIQANKRARLLLSEKRAAQGARGVVIREGSTLMEMNNVVANLEDTVFWINKGAEMSVKEIDLRLSSKLQATAWSAGTSLISNLGSAYTTSKMTINQPSSNSPVAGHYLLGHT